MSDNKRIGIITILKVNNYGAELQAFATQKILQMMGYDAEIIDYLFYKNPRHKTTPLSAPTAKMSMRKHLKERLYPIVANWKALKFRNAQSKRDEKFEQFHRDNTKQSECYRTLDELKAAKLDYDVIMSGSDQVWNPGIYSSLDPYLLRFGTREMKRIAYASSFGVSNVPDDVVEYYRESLSDYSAIGVREDKAVDLVKRLSGKNARQVLDPTLLLNREQWMQVAKPVQLPYKKYILIYELANVPYIKQLALHISKETGLPIVRICKNASVEDVEPEITNIIDAGPAEFLSLFDRAEYVVTNSFHGTAFSINFGRNFYTVIPNGKDNNSRQRSILKLMGCEERLVKEGSSFPKIIPAETDKIGNRLDAERINSLNFLKTAIDGE